MNLFAAVKETVTTRQAAEHYGIHVNRNGMCVCPFHNDKNPSMILDERYHCFGCQADGDVIDFTARLLHFSLKDAAIRLASDFGIRYDASLPYVPHKREPTEAERFEQQVNHCFHVLADYRNLLAEWREQYAPQTPTEDWHPRFVEALQETTQTEHLLDTMLSGSQADKQQIVNELSDRLPALEERMKTCHGKERPSVMQSLRQPSTISIPHTPQTRKESQALWNL